MLATLVDRMICETTHAPIRAALEPMVAACGVEITTATISTSGSRGYLEGFTLHFQPEVDSALVVAALRWSRPVAEWMIMGGMIRMQPLDAPARLGVWDIAVTLGEVPRAGSDLALPRIAGRELYDLSRATTTTRMINILPNEDALRRQQRRRP